MRTKFHLRCEECGFEILSESSERHCAKCDHTMKLIGMKNSKERFRR